MRIVIVYDINIETQIPSAPQKLTMPAKPLNLKDRINEGEGVVVLYEARVKRKGIKVPRAVGNAVKDVYHPQFVFFKEIGDASRQIIELFCTCSNW